MSPVTDTRPVVGIVLMSAVFDAQQLLDRVRMPRPDARCETDAVVSYEDDGVSVMLAPISEPRPMDELTECAHPMFVSDDDMPTLLGHSGHVVIVATDFSGESTPLEVARAHTRAVATMISQPEACGYARKDTTYSLATTKKFLADDNPTDLWAPIWLWGSDAGTTAYTAGLETFVGTHELQVVDSATDAVVVYETLRQIADDVIHGGVVTQAYTEKPWLLDTSKTAYELDI